MLEVISGLLALALLFTGSTRNVWADRHLNPTLETQSVSQIEHKFNPDWPKGDLFDESVHVLGGTRIPIMRWYEPIKLAVVGVNDQSVQATIESILNDISLFTGIRYRTLSHDLHKPSDYVDALEKTPDYELSICDSSEPGVCANFVVIISDKPTMHQIATVFPLRRVYRQATSEHPAAMVEAEVTCFFSPGIHRSTRIVQSVVYIQGDISDNLKTTCLQEEIYQSFGLFGDYSNSTYFSFNNQVKPKDITAFDKRLLSSLYDRSFTLGSGTVPVARQLSDYCFTRC